MKRELAEVRRARMAVQAAQVRLEAAVRAASAAGGSLREIGREAGVSYEQVRRLLSR
jgi:DNA-directed RNA polymerase specialized sigma24 family protein